MCKLDKNVADTVPAEEGASSTDKKQTNNLKAIIALLAVIAAAFLISTIVLADKYKDSKKSNNSQKATTTSTTPDVTPVQQTKTELGVNPCEGKKPAFANVQCIIDGLEQTGEQSGTNVTLGYKGDRNTTEVPITIPYWQAGLCPVNVSQYLSLSPPACLYSLVKQNLILYAPSHSPIPILIHFMSCRSTGIWERNTYRWANMMSWVRVPTTMV
jgi:hypothetical protein